MKKSIILTVFILLFSLCSFSAYADNSVPVISISDDIVAQPGDIVTIEVKAEIPQNTQIQGVQVDFEYSDNFPAIDSSKTMILTNTTSWTNIGITKKNLLGFGDVNTDFGEIIGKIVFQVPTDAIKGTNYTLQIENAIAATATEELNCIVNKNSIIITVGNDGQTDVSNNNQAGTSSGGINSTTPPPTQTYDTNNFDQTLGFIDVSKNDWFYESIKFVKNNQLMNGTSDTEFSPNANLTRAMLVTVLYRMENSPECNEPIFIDVQKNQWYSNGIAWAAENQIVNGIGNNKFAPNDNITREQIAVILYNYAKHCKYDVSQTNDLVSFRDADKISSWAIDSVKWAVATNLISGKGNGILDPIGYATRAEIATILKRFITAE